MQNVLFFDRDIGQKVDQWDNIKKIHTYLKYQHHWKIKFYLCG